MMTKLNSAKMILYDDNERSKYIASLEKYGIPDGLKGIEEVSEVSQFQDGGGFAEVQDGGGFAEVRDAAKTAERVKYTFKVKLEKKAKMVECFNYESLNQKVGEAFKVEMSKHELYVIDNDDDEIVIES